LQLRINVRLRSNLYRDTRIPHNTYIWTAKSAPYPPFPAERNLLPKTGTGGRPELRQVTQPPFIAGPLACIEKKLCSLDKYMMTNL
jgi:hypothetical protein